MRNGLSYWIVQVSVVVESINPGDLNGPLRRSTSVLRRVCLYVIDVYTH
jgi:hypothetical protein